MDPCVYNSLLDNNKVPSSMLQPCMATAQAQMACKASEPAEDVQAQMTFKASEPDENACLHGHWLDNAVSLAQQLFQMWQEEVCKQ